MVIWLLFSSRWIASQIVSPCNCDAFFFLSIRKTPMPWNCFCSDTVSQGSEVICWLMGHLIYPVDFLSVSCQNENNASVSNSSRWTTRIISKYWRKMGGCCCCPSRGAQLNEPPVYYYVRSPLFVLCYIWQWHVVLLFCQ